MYCKKCGKQIPDDSLFCQFCGVEQGESTRQTEVIMYRQNIFHNILSFIKALTSKQKIYGGIYVIWFILNCIWLIIGISVDNRRYSDVDYFFPFDEASFYDLSEFIVYVILLPFLVLFVRFIIQKSQCSFFKKRKR